MPRYFFHFRDGNLIHRDYEGEILQGADEARFEAITAAKQFVADALLNGAPIAEAEHQSFEVMDEDGGLVCTVRFIDTLADNQRKP